LVLAACAGLLLVSGCSEGEAKPAPGPDQTSASPPAVSSPPTLPEGAKDFSPRGLAAFAAYFVLTLDYAYRTGDVGLLADASSAECEGCQRYIDLLDSMFDSGGSTNGRTWTQAGSEVRFYPSRDDESFVSTSLTLSEGSIRMDASAPPTSYPAQTDKVTFGARYDGAWKMTQFGLGALQ